MRFLSLHCGQLTYEPVAPERPAIDLTDADLGPHAFDKCLYVMVGVQRGDATVVSAAAGLVHRICCKTDASLVVINSFASLVERELRAGPEEALTVSAQLQSQLLKRGYSVQMMPFGWMKDITVQIEAGVWQQRVEHLPPALEWGRRSHSLPADFEAA